MAEALGRTITKARLEHHLEGIKITENTEALTHQQFADDTMLLGSANSMEAMTFKSILNQYASASGQQVNHGKSEIFFFNTNYRIETEISRILEFLVGKLPCKYLGFNLDKGKDKKDLWKNITEKVKRKLDSWKNKWLSSAGRLTLIKSCLSAIPIY
ncbi:uncharacterized protein LOC131857424 [Cryptomeria japonica]|uniref:uncharacterized protein LOC131857424 n=1 Tax=Cryptomeria japonica TaxID=3369 RepID=UPI0027D9E874|nr:uncharacterized protein LOC131857424 [Cryptomeria japonica]